MRFKGDMEKFQQKRMKVSNDLIVVNKKDLSNTWGIPKENFLPERFSGETDLSISSHIKWLQNEVVKIKRDSTIIDMKMRITFPERRRMIIEEKATVSDIKKLFPILFQEDEV